MAPIDDLEDDEGDGDDDPDCDATKEVVPGDDGWLDLMDGKIRKRTLKEGSGAHPEVKQDVRCSVEIRLGGGGDSAEVLQHYRDVRYRIGEAEAPPMLELGLRYMQEGEECELFGVATMAFSSEGLPAVAAGEKPVPPDADLHMRVVLLEVLPATDGERRSWNDRIREVTWRKGNGNDHFKRRCFPKAVKCYAEGLKVFEDEMQPSHEAEMTDGSALLAEASGLCADCGANLAAVFLEQGEASKAKDAAKSALFFNPGHVKALYRVARACLILDEFAECEESVSLALELEPENAGVKRVQAEVQRKKERYAAKSKAFARRVVSEGLDYPDVASAESGAAGGDARGPWGRRWEKVAARVREHLTWQWAMVAAVPVLAALIMAQAK